MSTPDAHPAAGPGPAHQRAVADLSTALVAGLVATGLPHAVVLDSALTAYVTLLKQHPCCWQPAAGGLHKLADMFNARAEQQAGAAEQAAAAAIAAARKVC